MKPLVALLAVVVASAGCSDSVTSSSTTTAPLLTQSSRVADLLQEFPNPRLEGVTFVTDRERLSPQLELAYLSSARNNEVVDRVGVGLEPLDNATVLYLGYLYCYGMDNGQAPEVVMPELAATIVALDGRDTVTQDDNWRAMIISLAAASAPCSSFFDATAAFLESLVAEATS